METEKHWHMENKTEQLKFLDYAKKAITTSKNII